MATRKKKILQPPSMNNRTLLLLTLFIASVLRFEPAYSQSPLRYKERAHRSYGTWWEGKLTAPRTLEKCEIELLSVAVRSGNTSKVAATASGSDNTDTAKVRFFYSDTDKEPHITVRELSRTYGYWLDKAKPLSAWSKNAFNVFEWPVEGVLAQLRLPVKDLGVLVRLGSPDPSHKEAVIPASLYKDGPASAANGYIFYLQTFGNAKISADIFSETSRRVCRFPNQQSIHGRPFPLIWKIQSGASESRCDWGTASELEEGFYILSVKADFSGIKDCDKFSETHTEIVFYHLARHR